MRWALHVTLPARWVVKPMPAGLNTPSLAESWTEAKDDLSYTFTLRKGVDFQAVI
jgi:ABC-type transport system substrate-binding protein